MSNHDNDWLVERLRAFGAQPIDPATQSQHLTAMATAAVDQAQHATFLSRLGRRVQLGAAVAVGVLIGTTGLATAGALGPLQPIAAKGVEAVTPLDVPNGHGKSAEAHDKVKASGNDDDANGVERVTEGCEAGISTRNRGQYLKGIREKYGNDSAELTAAKASRCGMPVDSEGTPGADDDESSDAADTKAANADHGRPADAGKPEGDDDGNDGDHGDGKGKPDDTPGKPEGVGSSGKAASNGAPDTVGKPAGSAGSGAVDDAPGKCAGGTGFVPDSQPDCSSTTGS